MKGLLRRFLGSLAVGRKVLPKTEALENIRVAITKYLPAVAEELPGKHIRVVDVAI